MEESILIIKLTRDIENLSKEHIRKIASGNWKNVDPRKLKNINHVIVMVKGVCVADFSLGEKVIYFRSGSQLNRVALELTDYEGDFPFKDKRIDYKAVNPATIKSIDSLKNLIIS